MAAEHPVPWLVLCETSRRRWGGDLRRALIFRDLARRTNAIEAQGWNARSVVRARRAAGIRFRRPKLASSEFLTAGALRVAGLATRPVALDVHDHPIVQADAFGRSMTGQARRALAARIDRNLDRFPIHVVPSASFAELVGLDPSRVIVAPSGADTGHVVPRAFPAEPAIGFVSGAAPGRGIETLIDAAREVRLEIPSVRLLLWLATGDRVGEAYVAGLRLATAGDAWIEVGTAPYAELPAALARATVLAIPHPAGTYLDVAVPVKLADSMAAGRPLVVTPRFETRRIVEAADSGRVAAGDTPADLAAAIVPLLRDPELAARLGANGRAAAVRDYDWGVIGERVATAILARTDGAAER